MRSGTSTTTRRPTGGPDRHDARPRRRDPGRRRHGRPPDRPAGRRGTRRRRRGRHPRAASPARRGQQGLPGREARPGHLGPAPTAARDQAQDRRGETGRAQTARSARSPALAYRTGRLGTVSALLNSNSPERLHGPGRRAGDGRRQRGPGAARPDRHPGRGHPHPRRRWTARSRTAQAGRDDGQAQGAGRTGADRGRPPSRRPTATDTGSAAGRHVHRQRQGRAAQLRRLLAVRVVQRQRPHPGQRLHHPAHAARPQPGQGRRLHPVRLLPPAQRLRRAPQGPGLRLRRRRRAASAGSPAAATGRTATTWPRTSSATPTGSPCST